MTGFARQSRTARGLVVVIVMVALAGVGCRRQPPAEAYVPGLGEIMTLQQMRHVKLWFAGEARNWDLASYEVKELGEGFDDVVKLHPTHEESPVAPKDAIPRMITSPLGDLRDAVEKKDAARFEQTYDALTKACNDCHQATNFGFNVVQRPSTNPYSNQVFAPPPH
jgi:hypothetical protein